MGERQWAMGNKMTKRHFSCFTYSLVPIAYCYFLFIKDCPCEAYR